MGRSGEGSRADRAYRVLLLAYPRRFRSRFGQGMRATFLSDHARVRAAGRWGLAPFWGTTVVQALWFGATERARDAIGSLSSVVSLRESGVGSTVSDARHALRLLAGSPLLTAVSVASLAIGIASTAAVWTAGDALLFRASPGIRNSARIVEIARTTDGSGFGTLSYPTFRYLRDHARTLEAITATTLSPVPLSMRLGPTSERVYGRTVSSTFFDVLGVRPAFGRFFTPHEDDVPDARPVAVLSHRLWTRRFGASPSVLDEPIRPNGTTFIVVGVAEAGFENTTFLGTDLWIPMAMAGLARGEPTAELLADPTSTWHMAIGRLADGATATSARSELKSLLDAYRAETPSIPDSYGITVIPSGRVPPPVRRTFAAFATLLFALAGGLLAIACSNVTGALLARASARQREMATRLALGASHWRLIRQMLVETLVLFAVAGLVALALALWLESVLEALLPALPVPVSLDLGPGPRIFAFVGALCLVTGVVAGLAPARHALRTDVSRMLHGIRATSGPGRLRLRGVLVVSQVALSLALAVSAALFGRTLREAALVDTGFRTEGVTLVSLDTTVTGSTGGEGVALMGRVVGRVESISGVEAVGHSRTVPLQGGRFGLGSVRIPGDAELGDVRFDPGGWDVVSPGFFRAVGLPLREGRAFSPYDRDGSPPVAVVSESFAGRAWPGRSALGRRFWQIRGPHDDGRPFEVVGVVKDARYRSIGEPPQPFVFVPFAQHPQAQVELFVRHAPGLSIDRELRDAVFGVDPDLPVVQIQSFESAAALGLLPQRVAAWISGVGSGVGALLAALGVYGMGTFLAQRRKREIAIRIALGASRGSVRWAVVDQTLRLAASGGALGLGLALVIGRTAESLGLLVGVSPSDAPTLGAAALAMGVILLLASDSPARRAAATDPAAALRAE